MITYRYGTEPPQVADLWRPEGDTPVPVAVVVHGGFWRSYFTRRLMDRMCANLVERGWAAWNIEYRTTANGGGYPATLHDVAQAIGLLELVAARHALAIDRTIAIGHSAGAQLALLAAAREPAIALPEATARVPITRVISLAGVLDLERSEELGLGIHAAHEFLGGAPAERPDRYAAASPARRLPLGVPVTLLHGDQDANVPIAMSEHYLELARAAGDDVELVRLPGADHFGFLDPANEAWAAAAERLP